MMVHGIICVWDCLTTFFTVYSHARLTFRRKADFHVHVIEVRVVHTAFVPTGQATGKLRHSHLWTSRNATSQSLKLDKPIAQFDCRFLVRVGNVMKAEIWTS